MQASAMTPRIQCDAVGEILSVSGKHDATVLMLGAEVGDAAMEFQRV